jgi:hypothetical protein
MARKLKEKQCYYCGAPVVSMEHAPPKQMFKMFPCDSVTVYSCDQHNSCKSGADDAVIKAMLISLCNTSHLYPNRDLSVEKAIEEAKRYFPQVSSAVTTHHIIENAPENLNAKLAHLAPSVNIRQWMCQLTAALVYNGSKKYDPTIQWHRAIVSSPEWLPAKPGPLDTERLAELLSGNQALALLFESLDWQPGWPSGPRDFPVDIYRFQIHFASLLTIFKHQFFNSYTWYVGFDASRETKRKLIHKVRRVNDVR